MKTLILVRHAEAIAARHGVRDHARTLSARGDMQSRQMAQLLASRGTSPDYLVASDAVRTLATAGFFSSANAGRKVTAMEALYLADVNTILSVVHALPDQCDTVCMFGHNPGISELLDFLIPSRTGGGMSPCAMATLNLQAESWLLVSRDTMTLTHFDDPVVI